MKIAIFTPYNIYKSGGVQEHVNHQAELLRTRGHDVTIVTPRPRKELSGTPPAGTMFIGVSTRIKAPHATSADVSLSLDNEALDEVLANDFDIVHVHEPLSPVAARQILSRSEGKAVRIGTFHAALPGNRLGKSLVATYKTYARSVLPHIDLITAVSPAAIGYIEEYTDLTIHYIPNGIDLEKYKKRSIDRDPNMILFIGRLEKRKGAKQALQAFVELKKRKKDAVLHIAGDGPQRKSLQQFVADNEISDVVFHGFVDEREKLELLAKASVYTSPALYGESFGIVLAEAMAMGTPIVAHPNDGYRWVLKDTGRLSLVDCEDADEYADRIQLMMEDDGLRRMWQSWAAKYVKRFDYEKVVDQYVTLYKQALSQD